MASIKRVVSFVLVAVLVLCMTACGGSDTSTGGSAVGETGAWTINSQKLKTKLPKDVKEAFDKAMEGFTGSTLESVAYVGSHVVAGANYMILCRATTTTETPEVTYQMVIIYADLDGNAELTSMKEFDITEYVEGEGTKEQEMLAGGWTVPEDAAGSAIPKDAKAVYDKMMETVTWEWGEVDLLAFLGDQVVAGTNYSFLCKGTLTEDESAQRIFVLTIYEDPEGNVQILNENVLDLAEFNE